MLHELKKEKTRGERGQLFPWDAVSSYGKSENAASHSQDLMCIYIIYIYDYNIIIYV